MLNFRKIAADSAGKLVLAYYRELEQADPETSHGCGLDADGRVLASGGKLAAYYADRRREANWRPDISPAIAKVLGVDHHRAPKDSDLERLFEGKRGDTGEVWSKGKRTISALDLTFTPHKSVSLVAEMAKSPAERAAVWNAIERASHYTMGLVARDLGWARRGDGGKEGADPGEVAWVSFRHHNARPTTAVQDGRDGATLLADVPVVGDPNSHIHNLLFNVVVTDDGRIGSLDTKQFTRTKQHYYDAMFQGRLADELRRLGIRTEMHEQEKAVVIAAVPEKANKAFSKGTRQVLRHAKAYAESHGLVWDAMSAEQKFKILGVSGLAARLKKDGGRGAEKTWLEVAQAIGWERESVLENHKTRQMTDSERWQLGYKYAAKHLAKEFETQGVVDYEKLEMYAAMGLIGVGSKGGENDVARVAELLETRGITLRGEHVALITGATRTGIKVTNTAQLRIEESVLKLACNAGQDRSMTLSAEEINAAIARSDLDFTEEPEASAEQIAAIHSLGSGSSLSMLTGVAGAGKSTILRVLVDAWKRDTRLSPEGREIIGIATAWRQADALKEAGIGKTYALQPFLGQLGKRERFEDFITAVEKGTFVPTRNTVLVIDEVSQIGPRPMQKLLEVQARTGMTIKALGDREQTQAIEAGDAVELLQRALPEEDLPYLNHTVRQKDKRGRHIAGLFRAGAAAEAIDELRRGGEAALIGGDHDQVVNRLAEFYLQRRDLHRSAGTGLTVTMTAPTNQDVADLSVSVRTKLKERGEIGPDERTLPAIDQRGEQFEMPLAVGDQLRLFRRTYARTKAGEKLTFCHENHIGNNGSLVTVLSVSDAGITVRGKGVQKGETKVGEIPWSQLVDVKTGRFLVGFGHALTIDAAQGISSGEHINALPRGSAGVNAFKSYSAQTRGSYTNWLLVSEVAQYETVRRKQALGELTPITVDDLWKETAKDMSAKPYKPLASDLLGRALRDRDNAIVAFLMQDHEIFVQEEAGRKIGAEVKERRKAEMQRQVLATEIGALEEAIARNSEIYRDMRDTVVGYLEKLKGNAVLARRNMESAVAASRPAPGPDL